MYVTINSRLRWARLSGRAAAKNHVEAMKNDRAPDVDRGETEIRSEVMLGVQVTLTKRNRSQGKKFTSLEFRNYFLHVCCIVLSTEVPNLIRQNLGRDVDAFLADNGYRRSDLQSWVLHPGGPKVLQALATALGLHNGQLDASWDCLRR
jgi:predicted naringenin-chalcone synthase